MFLRQIKYFVTIVDCNSFTEAAEKCFISQSAISQQISALETELGVQLIKRGNRKFSLTLAGEYFYKRGRVILQDVDEMKNETVRLGSDDDLHLNIGYLASYDGVELSETIIEFSKVYPEVVVTVFKGTRFLEKGQNELLHRRICRTATQEIQYRKLNRTVNS